jgi:hypothetical protein
MPYVKLFVSEEDYADALVMSKKMNASKKRGQSAWTRATALEQMLAEGAQMKRDELAADAELGELAASLKRGERISW